MKRSLFLSLAAAALVAAASLALPSVFTAQPAEAAPPQIDVATPGVMTLPFVIAGQRAAGTTAAVARFEMPFPVRVLGVSAAARASSGTNPTLTVDVEAEGDSILADPIAVTAGEVAEGVVATALVAAGEEVTIDTVIGGTDTPTFSDITVLITVVRR